MSIITGLKDRFLEAIGQVIDRGEKLTDIAVSAGVGYYGYQVNKHWTGALTGLLGYKLARSENMVTGAAGVAILTALGVLALTKPWWAITQPPPPPAESLPTPTTTGIDIPPGLGGGLIYKL